MKNGREKQQYILRQINRYCKKEKTIIEMWQLIEPHFEKGHRITFSAYYNSIRALMKDSLIEYRKELLIEKTGSRNKIYLINKKQKENEFNVTEPKIS